MFIQYSWLIGFFCKLGGLLGKSGCSSVTASMLYNGEEGEREVVRGLVRSGNDPVYFGLHRPETRNHVVARGQESGEAQQKIRLSLIYRHQTLIVRDSFSFCPLTLLFSLTIFSIASIPSLTTPQQPSYISSNPIRVPKSTRRSEADPL